MERKRDFWLETRIFSNILARVMLLSYSKNIYCSIPCLIVIVFLCSLCSSIQTFGFSLDSPFFLTSRKQVCCWRVRVISFNSDTLLSCCTLHVCSPDRCTSSLCVLLTCRWTGRVCENLVLWSTMFRNSLKMLLGGKNRKNNNGQYFSPEFGSDSTLCRCWLI